MDSVGVLPDLTAQKPVRYMPGSEGTKMGPLKHLHDFQPETESGLRLRAAYAGGLTATLWESCSRPNLRAAVAGEQRMLGVGRAHSLYIAGS